jgi:hypothetical protein
VPHAEPGSARSRFDISLSGFTACRMKTIQGGGDAQTPRGGWSTGLRGGCPGRRLGAVRDHDARPLANGGYVIRSHGQMPMYVTPRAGGGYVVQTPGQAPSYIRPEADGGFVVQAPRPGAAAHQPGKQWRLSDADAGTNPDLRQSGAQWRLCHSCAWAGAELGLSHAGRRLARRKPPGRGAPQWLIGGAGDTLNAGSSADTFMFSPNWAMRPSTISTRRRTSSSEPARAEFPFRGVTAPAPRPRACAIR